MRRCPGVGGRKCGTFISTLFGDPHPTCSSCRGRSCSYKSTCKTCDGWSLDQWEHYRRKRTYAGRSKSSSRHAGDPIETASNPPLSPASTRSVSPAPPSPLERLGEGREAPSVVDIKEPCFGGGGGGGGGGESAQPQPNTLPDKSPPSLSYLGLKSPPTTKWTIGEKKAKIVFPLLPPPRRRLRGGGRRENRAQTAHGHQIFREKIGPPQLRRQLGLATGRSP